VRRATGRKLRFDPAGPRLLLSPHFDDVALNCWSYLTGPDELKVVNVFSAVPRTRTPGEWDRLCGAADARAHARARREEDAEVLAGLGREAANLPFVERQYRHRLVRPRLAKLDAAVAASMPAASRVLAPLGIGHPDHKLLRRYALRLRAAGFPVSLYAEVPHGVPVGWPDWVTGGPPTGRGPELVWEPVLSRLGSPPPRPRVVRLSEQESDRKLAALRAYRTQFTALDRGPIGVLRNPLIRAFEVFWDLDGSSDY
jgi:LmbE family N-acetylglucosaminyl deacetylase